MVIRFSEETKIKKERPVQWHEFLSLESPHPHGVLPGGNRFLLGDEEEHSDGNNSQSTTSGNSNATFFGQLQNKDDLWLEILGFLDGETLGSVVQTCRFFYVAGHQPELWRDLVLRRQDRAKHKAIEQFAKSWKDTYVLMYHKLSQPSKPIHIPGLYSDDLYRLHSCRAFGFPSSWLQETPFQGKTVVPSVLVDDLTAEQFVRNYEELNRPVLIKGACRQWKAFQDWQDPEYLKQHAQGRTFRATSGAAPLPANFTLEAFQTYCNNPHLEEAPLYLFDRDALQLDTPLHQDFYPDMRSSCPYFDPERAFDPKDIVGHDLFQVLGQDKRPDHTWKITGGSHSGSVFHIDPNATHAWNATIVGRKRWLFYPPGVTPPGVHPSQDGDEVALPLSVGEWILTFWKDHQELKRTSPPSDQPLECTAFPGDVVFVPHGWWHMVINLDAPFNIAVTHNYVSRSNLGNVLRFLRLREDQISGCRDRAESVKPDQLHSAFVQALHDKFGEDTDWLVKAQQQAASHWTCRAWNDDDLQDGEDSGNSNNRQKGFIRPLCKKQRTGDNNNVTHVSSCGSSVMSKAKAESSSFSFSFL